MVSILLEYIIWNHWAYTSSIISCITMLIVYDSNVITFEWERKFVPNYIFDSAYLIQRWPLTPLVWSCALVLMSVECSAGCPPGVNPVCCTGLTADWLPHWQRQRPCHGKDLGEVNRGTSLCVYLYLWVSMGASVCVSVCVRIFCVGI